MSNIVLNDIEYELVKNYKNAFTDDEFRNKYTEYFGEFDYILGDYSYDKLRLKGFCVHENKNLKDYNDYEKIEEYIKNQCSYDCRYFILQRKNKKND